MSKSHWWQDVGPFLPWKDCPSRPDPAAVLLFYLEKRGIKPEERVDYLKDILEMQKSTVYNLLKGEGLDMISRTRLLVHALRIPPPLLGIDGKYYPIEQHTYWWKACGYSFHADAQGYPVASDVIAYLRLQRTQRSEKGRIKAWSQEDLAEATDLKKETIYRMENDKNPLILESMDRRALVASALGNRAGENEPTLFRLFGLDPQAYGLPVADHESVPLISLPTKTLSHSVLQGYHQQLAAFFTQYYTHHGQDGEVHELQRETQALLSKAGTVAQRLSVLALASRSHQLLLLIASEQQERERMAFHAGEAIKLAESATTLPDVGDQTGLRMSHELLTAALCRTALASYGLDQYDAAQESIQRALDLLLTVQSRQLKSQVLLDAALIHAQTASSPIDQQLVLSYFHQAESLLTSASQSGKPDENAVRCDKGLLYLRKGMALSAPHMKGASGESVIDLLEDAQRWIGPQLLRRQVTAEIFLALAYFAAGHYQRALAVALSALEKSRQIHSRLSRDRIEGLYRLLLSTPLRDKTCLSHLSVKLRRWEYGMDGSC